MKKILLIILLSILYPQSQVGTTSANFLGIGLGARAIGMGGAHVAVGNGIYAAPYNTASIGFIKGSDSYFSRTNYVADITHNVLGYAKALTSTDFVGIHLFYMDVIPYN